MKLSVYLKSKALLFVLLFAAGWLSSLLLAVLGVGYAAILFIDAVFLAAAAGFCAWDYGTRRGPIQQALETAEGLDKKFMLSELIDPPAFPEGEVYYDLLRQASKAMNDEIAKYRVSSLEYREYIETWVHEIKTPIASALLIAENNPSPAADRMRDELARIDGFVEQALYYSRSSSVEKDYVIKTCSLRELASASVKKNARLMIDRKIAVSLDGISEDTVMTDPKWIDFILSQILVNSVKYGAKAVRFSSRASGSSVTLRIEDDGIGIPVSDLGRVFEKGFTGQNGRSHAKSTGLGLYLCRKLCKKLGIGITLTSTEGKGTAVQLLFPKSGMHLLEEN